MSSPVYTPTWPTEDDIEHRPLRDITNNNASTTATAGSSTATTSDSIMSRPDLDDVTLAEDQARRNHNYNQYLEGE